MLNEFDNDGAEKHGGYLEPLILNPPEPIIPPRKIYGHDDHDDDHHEGHHDDHLLHDHGSDAHTNKMDHHSEHNDHKDYKSRGNKPFTDDKE